jgi:hypothetical protein
VAVVDLVKNLYAQGVSVVTDTRIVGDQGEFCAQPSGVALDQEQIELALEHTTRAAPRRDDQQDAVRLYPSDFVANGMVVVVWIEVKNLLFQLRFKLKSICKCEPMP